MIKKRYKPQEPENRKSRKKHFFPFLLFAVVFLTAGFLAANTLSRLPDNGNTEQSSSEILSPDQSSQENLSPEELSAEQSSAEQSSTVQSSSEISSPEPSSLEQSSFVPPESEEQQFFVYFIDVGQGDASLITCDGHSMLIDGGRNKQSQKIYSFLKNKGVTHLDYIVATHMDDDHIGGLAAALNFATVDVAFSPVSDDDSQSFLSFKKYLDIQGVEITIPKAGEQYPLGSSLITVLGPTEIVDSDNNNSIVLKVEHGENSFLFTGDAERKEETDILNTASDLKSTVLKVGHHGSASSTGDDFLLAVDPEAAVISCGHDNEYGHPTEEVLNKLEKKGIRLYRTDLQGDITFFEENGNLVCEVERNPDVDVFMPGYNISDDPQGTPSQQISPIEETSPIEEADASAGSTATRNSAVENAPERHEMDYIVNIKTGKFHYPDCTGVKKMKDANKRYVTCDRQDLIDQGYDPCGLCRP